jgi:hypothetical protein
MIQSPEAMSYNNKTTGVLTPRETIPDYYQLRQGSQALPNPSIEID